MKRNRNEEQSRLVVQIWQIFSQQHKTTTTAAAGPSTATSNALWSDLHLQRLPCQTLRNSERSIRRENELIQFYFEVL